MSGSSMSCLVVVCCAAPLAGALWAEPAEDKTERNQSTMQVAQVWFTSLTISRRYR